jgi:hypothetical protein
MAKSDLIKRPHQLDELTPAQIQEYVKCANDPIYFAKHYCKVQHPKHGSIPFIPYDYQIRCIEAFKNNRWSIVLAGRQLGKSTIIAIYILWFAIFNTGKHCLVASNKNSNAIEIMNRIKYAYEELPMWLKPGCIKFNAHSVEFDSGSRIESQATTEKTGRGGSFALVMLDELAFVPRRIQEAMWISLAPTISTGGSIIVSSTPNGDQDLFATLWRKAEMGSVAQNEENFAPVRVDWDEHPDRDENFKASMTSKVGEIMWKQEYECFCKDTKLTINNNGKIQKLTVGELYDLLYSTSGNTNTTFQK